MAYFKIDEPNQPTKWIKEVDNANGKLVFQDSRDNAYYQDSGFFADSELEYLKFHFTKEYPELEFMTIDDGQSDDYWEDQAAEEEMGAAPMLEEVGGAMEEAPILEEVWNVVDVPGEAAW